MQYFYFGSGSLKILQMHVQGSTPLHRVFSLVNSAALTYMVDAFHSCDETVHNCCWNNVCPCNIGTLVHSSVSNVAPYILRDGS